MNIRGSYSENHLRMIYIVIGSSDISWLIHLVERTIEVGTQIVFRSRWTRSTFKLICGCYLFQQNVSLTESLNYSSVAEQFCQTITLCFFLGGYYY